MKDIKSKKLLTTQSLEWKTIRTYSVEYTDGTIETINESENINDSF